MDYDLIVRGGTVADGKGGALVEADVAVKDGLIAAVGKVSGRAKEEIEAKGKLVTPGFVDIHTHYDAQALWDQRLAPSSWHGVTTTVFGNCGVGFAPVKNGDRDLLIEIMEGVEDIPGNVLREGLNWSWNSFPEYMDALGKRSYDMDIGAQLPHAALRVYVMGQRGVNLEPATQADIAEMRRLTAEAMRAGAIGVSTSRSLNHQTVKGDPTPTLRAHKDELVGIASGLRDAGQGVIELTAGFTPQSRPEEFDMTRSMAEASGRPLSLLVLQRHNDPNGWRDLMAGIEAANKAGHHMRAQIAPRSIGSMLGLLVSRHPFYLYPSFKAIAKEPLEKKIATFRDPSFRARLLSEKPEHKNERTIRRMQVWDHMFRLGNPPNYEPLKSECLGEMARSQGRRPEEVAYDVMMEDDGHGLIFSPNTNYASYDLDVCREMIRHPYTVLGLSDGGAHMASIADSSFPTFLLTYWGRDRKRGEKIDVGWLVRWMTSATAAAVGLTDRGILAPGYRADLNVIDFDKLRTKRPYMASDLPVGGRRLLVESEGYVATFVAGVATYRDGKATGALPGRLVRSKPAAKAAAAQ
jgi:N-acyl-D-aspartate/D-glutamate deacylase